MTKREYVAKALRRLNKDSVVPMCWYEEWADAALKAAAEWDEREGLRERAAKALYESGCGRRFCDLYEEAQAAWLKRADHALANGYVPPEGE